jgi:hypothetical protein
VSTINGLGVGWFGSTGVDGKQSAPCSPDLHSRVTAPGTGAAVRAQPANMVISNNMTVAAPFVLMLRHVRRQVSAGFTFLI